MSEKPGEKSDDEVKPNKTDSLIEQAIAEMNPVSRTDDSESGIVSAEESGSDKDKKSKVAQIDVEQYVNKEAYMRLAADFDNFRKRVLKERKEWERQGKEKVFHGFLDVLDNLRRGLQQAEGDESAFAAGMRMVLSQAELFLQTEGLQRISSVGETFDPSVHEAVARIEMPGKSDGVIVEEIKSGYKWGEHLLRPASVVVVKNEGSSDSEEETVVEKD